MASATVPNLSERLPALKRRVSAMAEEHDWDLAVLNVPTHLCDTMDLDRVIAAEDPAVQLYRDYLVWVLEHLDHSTTPQAHAHKKRGPKAPSWITGF